ncbi:ATP-dependent nuclease [Lichenicoccus sp.]|uniref:ATP-dependent nuclease n=1 Tax=Lichenicoccus sp. TaxID=2781899 RepID=UPI003D14A4CD
MRIINFANFQDLDIRTGENIVIVGENKVGKSNFLRAIQLILDPSLSERERRLGLEHFWDGLGDNKLGETVEVSIELTERSEDPRLLRYLADCIVEAGPPFVARLTYRYQPKPGLGQPPTSLADYEYVIFGGVEPDNGYGSDLRRLIPMDVQGALRDAEKDLASWRHSPLRPLIDSLATKLGDESREEIQNQIDVAQATLNARPEIEGTADLINMRLTQMVGEQHANILSLGLAPTRLDALLRGLRLLIDHGARPISDASLGSANLIFLALKSLELDRLVTEGERDHTFFAVEEPEAHLHPHVQRLVYRHFLAPQTADDLESAPRRQTTILTTHSPHIASVAPLRSIVLLRRDRAAEATTGVAAAHVPLTDADLADLQRYIDVTRAELFFSRGIILVEGDAERFLIPAFANVLNIPLDALGISVCSVAGTNFEPFVKLLGPKGLNIPFVILSDRDLVGGRDYGLNRVKRILKILRPNLTLAAMETEAILSAGHTSGIFLNRSTLEIELFQDNLATEIQTVLLDQLSLTQTSRDELQGWVDDIVELDQEKLLRWIDRIGKGRFAQKLAQEVTVVADCPDYILRALQRIRDALA